MKSIISSRIGASMAVLATLATLVTVSNAPANAGEFAEHHPRRAEVLRRDRRLNHRINNNKGNLGGHYGQLKAEDNAIHQQERADKNANGGHITRAEKHQLNKEENALRHQIRTDKK